MITTSTPSNTLDEQVDVALHRIALAPTLMLAVNELYNVSTMNESSYQLDHLMLEKGLIKVVDGGRALTGKGLEISNFGGWLLYQQQLKKDRTGTFAESNPSFKHRVEIQALQAEIERYKAELKVKHEKEESAALIIKNLVEQTGNSKVMMLLTGAVIGIILSSVIWIVSFR